MNKRYTITVTEAQAAWLEEISEHDEVSVSHVIRDALRAQLPRLVELNRWLSADAAQDRSQALALMGSLDGVDAVLSQGIDAVSEADIALPIRRKSHRNSPPSSNTGANSPLGG